MVRRVVLVYGPPCAGKSTHAEAHAHKGAHILDLDKIAQECASQSQWRHDPQITAIAERVMRSRMRALVGQNVEAWVIRTAPTQRQRDEATALCDATEVVALVPTMSECIARARRDKRPRGTEQAIRKWFAMHN